MSVDPRVLIGNHSEKIVGPWPCEKCGHLSQFASVRFSQNNIYCKNPNCDFTRKVDKLRSRIIESDGTIWAFNNKGDKWRIRG